MNIDKKAGYLPQRQDYTKNDSEYKSGNAYSPFDS